MINYILNPYVLGGVALLGLSLFGVYKYQAYTINNLEVKLQEAETETENLKTNITGIQDTISVFKTNQEEATRERIQLQSTIPRLDVLKAKPTLVSKMIEDSYANFHLEKACFSGNKEACDALNN